MMDIDQRIEALTQSVELLAGMHKDLATSVGKLTRSSWRTEKRMKALMDVAFAHDYCLTAIEKKLDQ